MINLAGNEEADKHIRAELTRCGIEVIESEDQINHPDVKTRLAGKLGPFTFRRNWYYWVVSGEIPLEVAEKLYADPVGKTDIRSGGDCACRPPQTWATYYDAEGKKLVNDPDGQQERDWNKLAESWISLQEKKSKLHFVVNAAEVAVKAVVGNYHIDSELGLYIFVQTLKEAKLI